MSSEEIMSIIQAELDKRLAVRTYTEYNDEQNKPEGRVTVIIPS